MYTQQHVSLKFSNYFLTFSSPPSFGTIHSSLMRINLKFFKFWLNMNCMNLTAPLCFLICSFPFATAYRQCYLLDVQFLTLHAKKKKNWDSSHVWNVSFLVHCCCRRRAPLTFFILVTENKKKKKKIFALMSCTKCQMIFFFPLITPRLKLLRLVKLLYIDGQKREKWICGSKARKIKCLPLFCFIFYEFLLQFIYVAKH